MVFISASTAGQINEYGAQTCLHCSRRIIKNATEHKYAGINTKIVTISPSVPKSEHKITMYNEVNKVRKNSNGYARILNFVKYASRKTT